MAFERGTSVRRGWPPCTRRPPTFSQRHTNAYMVVCGWCCCACWTGWFALRTVFPEGCLLRGAPELLRGEMKLLGAPNEVQKLRHPVTFPLSALSMTEETWTFSLAELMLPLSFSRPPKRLSRPRNPYLLSSQTREVIPIPLSQSFFPPSLLTIHRSHLPTAISCNTEFPSYRSPPLFHTLCHS